MLQQYIPRTPISAEKGQSAKKILGQNHRVPRYAIRARRAQRTVGGTCEGFRKAANVVFVNLWHVRQKNHHPGYGLCKRGPRTRPEAGGHALTGIRNGQHTNRQTGKRLLTSRQSWPVRRQADPHMGAD